MRKSSPLIKIFFFCMTKECGVIYNVWANKVGQNEDNAEVKLSQGIKELLEDILKIVPDHLPNVLPPIRHVQHAIDLVLKLHILQGTNLCQEPYKFSWHICDILSIGV